MHFFPIFNEYSKIFSFFYFLEFFNQLHVNGKVKLHRDGPPSGDKNKQYMVYLECIYQVQPKNSFMDT